MWSPKSKLQLISRTNKNYANLNSKYLFDRDLAPSHVAGAVRQLEGVGGKLALWKGIVCGGGSLQLDHSGRKDISVLKACCCCCRSSSSKNSSSSFFGE